MKYNNQGDTAFCGSYLKGKEDGLFTSYFETGELHWTGGYQEGKKSEWFTYYNEKGVIVLKERYVDHILVKKVTLPTGEKP